MISSPLAMVKVKRPVWSFLCASVPLATWFFLSIWQSPSNKFRLDTRDNNVASVDYFETRLMKVKELEERRQRVRKVCAKHGTMVRRRLTASIVHSYMLDAEHKLLYCRHGKVGTSTWLEYFLQLSNYTENDKVVLGLDNRRLHGELPKYFNLMQHNITTIARLRRFSKENDILSFSFVRHPFDRLVSAFEDKIRFNSDLSYKNLSAQFNGSFPAFADYVVAQFDPCGPLQCDAVDLHWRRYVDRCGFCDVDFQVIGHAESFAEDVRFILEEKKLTHLLRNDGSLPPRRNPDPHGSVLRRNAVPHNGTRTQEYFSQLDPDVRKKLHKIYEVDFELFGYDANMYL